MFILEGIDDVGKTTAAMKLVRYMNSTGPYGDYVNVHYQHMGRPSVCFDFFKDYRHMINPFAVQDRFHIGAFLWHNGIQQDRLRTIEGWLGSVGSYTVLFFSSDVEMYRLHLEREGAKHQHLAIDHIDRANRYIVEGKHPFHYDEDWDFSELGYPGEADIQRWAGEWWKRLDSFKKGPETCVRGNQFSTK